MNCWRFMRLPIEPFSQWLADFQRLHELNSVAVARAVGCDESWVRRLRNGAYSTVTDHTVERFGAALNDEPTLVHALYPDLMEVSSA